MCYDNLALIKKFVSSDLDIMNLIINNYNLRYKSDLGYKEFLVIKNIFSGPAEFVITRFDCIREWWRKSMMAQTEREMFSNCLYKAKGR